MLKKLKIESHFDFLEIVGFWPELVGPFLAPNSIPLKVKSQTLFVLVRHSVFSQELTYLGEKIKERLHKKFPHLKNQISKLAFEVNESFFNAKDQQEESIKIKQQQLHPHSPQMRKLRQEAQQLFPELLDQEEKDQWISLYIQSML